MLRLQSAVHPYPTLYIYQRFSSCRQSNRTMYRLRRDQQNVPIRELQEDVLDQPNIRKAVVNRVTRFQRSSVVRRQLEAFVVSSESPSPSRIRDAAAIQWYIPAWC